MSTCNKPELRVLELISTPMKFNGQTLFPLRITKQMKHVCADFLSYHLGSDEVRTEIEAMGGNVYIAPHRLKHPLRYLQFTSRLVREQGYDIVHCHGNSCTLAIDLLAAKLGGAKVRIAHSHNSQCKFAVVHHILRPLFNRLYTHAMACGEEAGRWLFGKRPFSIIRNAIDIRAFAFDPELRDSLRKEYDCENNVVLGCVASLTDIKNHAFLMKVFAGILERNPSYLLMLAGDGPLRENLEQQAKQLGIADSVRFLGSRNDIAQLLQMMDVMALPSLFEGFPTVALEWQCAGLPVMLSENITPDCAFTRHVHFQALDTEAWISAILGLSEFDRAAASRSGIVALSQAGYDLSAAAKALEENYRRFID